MDSVNQTLERERSRSPVRNTLSEPKAKWPFGQSYTDVDVKEWTISTQPKPNNNGGVIFNAIWSSQTDENSRPTFVLLDTDAPPPYVEFPMDLDPMKGKPSFLSKDFDHTNENNALETLCVTLSIPVQMANAYKDNIERGVRDIAIKNPTICFDKKTAAAVLDKSVPPDFSSGVRVSENQAHRINVPIALAGPPWALTALTIKKTTGEVVKGSGWEFLQENMGTSRLKNAKVVATLSLLGIWSRPKTFGATIRAKEALFYLEKPSDVSDSLESPQLQILHEQIMNKTA